MRDIEEWLREEGIRQRIYRGRTPDVPIEAVTLFPRGGTGFQADGAITVAGLDVRCRHQSFDAAEDLAHRVDAILVPYEALSDHNGVWIGHDARHMTKIIATGRPGSEPQVVALDDSQVVFSASYLVTAVRRSRNQAQIPTRGDRKSE